MGKNPVHPAWASTTSTEGGKVCCNSCSESIRGDVWAEMNSASSGQRYLDYYAQCTLWEAGELQGNWSRSQHWEQDSRRSSPPMCFISASLTQVPDTTSRRIVIFDFVDDLNCSNLHDTFSASLMINKVGISTFKKGTIWAAKGRNTKACLWGNTGMLHVKW
jgi:hypothetical protein